MNWIDCKQEMPPEGLDVLTFKASSIKKGKRPTAFREISVARLMKSGIWSTRYTTFYVTHWQPLPDAPPVAKAAQTEETEK